MGRQVVYNIEARAALKKGVDALADAVKVTLGPQGRNVVIDLNNQDPFMTKDGVTVAKYIFLNDPIENIGAQMVKNVASKTASDAGDGTTTATVLAQAILDEGIKNVTAGASPMDIKKGIDKAVIEVVKSLKKQSKKITKEKTIQIATISANGDEFIGSLISEAVNTVGKDGVITIEESKNGETTVKMEDGMQVDRGYISPYLVTDAKTMEAELVNPAILIVDKKIDNIKDLLPVMEANIKATGTPILIICEEVVGQAFEMLITNKMKGTLRVCVIKSPGFGGHSFELLEDIAIATGATVISDKAAIKLVDAKFEMLGRADKVTVSKTTTTILKGKGDPIKIKNRVEDLRGQIKDAESDLVAYNLKERLAKLVGGVAVLYIGATTEVEMKEKMDRVDDALHATRAAIEEGIVPGGGVALIRAIKAIQGLKGANDTENIGIDIIRKAIESPLRQICKNADVEGSVIINNILTGREDYGYNARTGKFENLIAAGVIDPTKVTRIALENAASIASMLLTTECILADSPLPDDRKK